MTTLCFLITAGFAPVQQIRGPRGTCTALPAGMRKCHFPGGERGAKSKMNCAPASCGGRGGRAAGASINWSAPPSGQLLPAEAAEAIGDARGWLQEVAAGGTATGGGWHEATQVRSSLPSLTCAWLPRRILIDVCPLIRLAIGGLRMF